MILIRYRLKCKGYLLFLSVWAVKKILNVFKWQNGRVQDSERTGEFNCITKLQINLIFSQKHGRFANILHDIQTSVKHLLKLVKGFYLEFMESMIVSLWTVTQELYEKSLVRVEDNSLSVDLLEIKTFLTVPQVRRYFHYYFTVILLEQSFIFVTLLMIVLFVSRIWWRSWRYVRSIIW